jgi:hypothetical protein
VCPEVNDKARLETSAAASARFLSLSSRGPLPEQNVPGGKNTPSLKSSSSVFGCVLSAGYRSKSKDDSSSLWPSGSWSLLQI